MLKAFAGICNRVSLGIDTAMLRAGRQVADQREILRLRVPALRAKAKARDASLRMTTVSLARWKEWLTFMA